MHRVDWRRRHLHYPPSDDGLVPLHHRGSLGLGDGTLGLTIRGGDSPFSLCLTYQARVL